MNRESWKAQDRPCPPCAVCGTELCEQFWGDGGWVKADKETGQIHGVNFCIARLKADLAVARSKAERATRAIVALLRSRAVTEKTAAAGKTRDGDHLLAALYMVAADALNEAADDLEITLPEPSKP